MRPITSLRYPERAAGFAARLALRLDGEHFRVEVADGRIEAERGETPAPDATVDTDPGTLIALLHGYRTLPEALRAGDVAVAGDERVAVRFLGLFPLPEPAVA